MLDELCPMVDRLPARERKRLLDRSVPRRLARGEALFLAEEPAAHSYVLTRGALKLSLCDASGSETILDLVGSGSLVGEIGGIEGGSHPNDAIALVPSTAIALPADLFVELVTCHRAAALELVRHLAARDRKLINVTLERTVSHIPVRLAGRLLDLGDTFGRMNEGAIEMELPLAQEDLGRLAGMCRESTCKMLGRFKRAGVVDYRGRTLRILRPDVLEKLRCGARAGAPSR